MCSTVTIRIFLVHCRSGIVNSHSARKLHRTTLSKAAELVLVSPEKMNVRNALFSTRAREEAYASVHCALYSHLGNRSGTNDRVLITDPHVYFREKSCAPLRHGRNAVY